MAGLKIIHKVKS